MPNNEFMALFGSQSVMTSVVSENDSVKYKLVVRGSNGDSRINDIEVTLNDKDLISRTSQRGRGMNLAVINADTLALVEWKVFDIYVIGNNQQAFIDYVNGLPSNRIVCLYTFDGIQTTDALDAFITDTMGSLAWPGAKFINRPGGANPPSTPQRSSYSAIYNSKLKKITCENFVGNVNSGLAEDTRSFCEVVFDTIDDIGATGIPQRITDDLTERTGDGSKYTVYTWPNPQAVGSQVYVGDILRVTADLFQDQALTDAGGYAMIGVTAYDSSGTPVGEKRIDSRGAVGAFISKEDYFTVPANSATVSMSFYHFPSTVGVGTSKVRNVILTKASRIGKSTGTAAIGVNGIRMESAKEVNDGVENPLTKLLKLPVGNAGTSPSKVMNASNFGELETIIDDPATTDSGTSNATYQFKSWAANDVMLSSLNAKPGDTIVVTGELARDAAAISGGKYPYVLVRFAQGATYISDDGIQGITSVANVFEFRKKEVVIPPGTDRIRMYAVRGPNGLTASGNNSVRNVKYRIKRGA